MESWLVRFYNRLVIQNSLVTLMVMVLITGCLGWFSQEIRVDISADSLILENDPDLLYYRSIRARYENDDFLVVTYTPKGSLFTRETLDRVAQLRDKLAKIKRVKSVISILDVPLVQSPPMSLSDLQRGLRTLSDPDTDLALAQRELINSPLYRDRLVGASGDTTAIQINLLRDEEYIRLHKSRDKLRAKRLDQPLTPTEEWELERITDAFRKLNAKRTADEKLDIAEIRHIMDPFRSEAELHLGGAPMIISDMMDFVRYDVRVFGLSLLVVLALILGIAFRELRWVFLPLLTAGAVGLTTVGILALGGWAITVVSSNFLALLLIFVLSLTIHLVVRYGEIQENHPQADSQFLVSEMVKSKIVPCFYMIATTLVAFGSLVVSGIRPVIDFGWMMAISLAVSLIFTFTLFPAAVMVLGSLKKGPQKAFSNALVAAFPPLLKRRGNLVFMAAFLVVGLGLLGMSKLTVENRFIDNFKSTTEIYQGMYLIDQKLGGTSPLEVIIDAPRKKEEQEKEEEEEEEGGLWGELDDAFDSAIDTVMGGTFDMGITGSSYWFNSFMSDKVAAIHTYLDERPETGKVLSLSSTLQVLTQINDGSLPSDMVLSILYSQLPASIKGSLFDPYLSEDGNQLRFDVRVYESDASIKRNELLDSIRRDLTEKFGLEEEQVHLSGMLVLYNNMLQSLFQSQILTLGAVFLAILFMFIVLFRSIKLALIGIVPSLLTVPVVLGLMGGMGIPLDIMTITIAAISIGMGVDNTIHYVHRFGTELSVDGDYWKAIERSHGSIGRAMYYTTATITLGFSILALSRFVPTIYFGVLTAFAMLMALVANLTILPLLLERLKPYGK